MWLRDMYQLPGVRQTVDLPGLIRSYYVQVGREGGRKKRRRGSEGREGGREGGRIWRVRGKDWQYKRMIHTITPLGSLPPSLLPSPLKLFPLNPSGICPVGPTEADLRLLAPHDRAEKFGGGGGGGGGREIFVYKE